MNEHYIPERKLPFADGFLTLRMGKEGFEGCDYWDVSSHSNIDYEMHILLAGSCKLEVGSQTVFLPSDHGILIRRGVFHRPCSVSGDLMRFAFSFMPDTPQLETRLFENLGDFAVFALTEAEVSLCRETYSAQPAYAPFREDALQAIFIHLLVSQLRKLCPISEKRSFGDHDSRQQRLVAIDRFFDLWRHPCGTEEALARQLNLSRRQLGRLLQAYYGMSFREKLRQARMEYAGSLLRTTDWKVADICRAVGYSEETFFFKVFRAYYRMTPRQYREKMKNQDVSYLEESV